MAVKGNRADIAKSVCVKTAIDYMKRSSIKDVATARKLMKSILNLGSMGVSIGIGGGVIYPIDTDEVRVILRGLIILSKQKCMAAFSDQEDLTSGLMRRFDQ
jgi:hypothetical protein